MRVHRLAVVVRSDGLLELAESVTLGACACANVRGGNREERVVVSMDQSRQATVLRLEGDRRN